MKNKIQLLYLFLAIAAIGGCKDDDAPEPGPCAAYPEKMEIQMLITDPRDLNIYIPTFDTVFGLSKNLYFFTNFEYDSVFWQIGTDPTIWNRKGLPLRFEEEAVNTTVTITARCFRPVDQRCFGAKDDGIDTLTRTITFRARKDSPLHGIWRGTNDGEKDSFDVEIHRMYWTDAQGEEHYKGFRFTGIPKGTQTSTRYTNISIDWFSFIYTQGSDYDENWLISRTVEGRMQENGNIQINWKIYKDDRLRTFTGKRIN